MKHRQQGSKLNRDIKHRKALFKNLISALILTGQIKTTEAKAKAIRRLVDKLISRAKRGTLHARRLIAAFLNNKAVVNKLVDEVAPRFKNRSSGFTSIHKLTHRRGDNALIVDLKLVDHPEDSVPQPKTAQKAPSKPSLQQETPRPLPADQTQPVTTAARTKQAAQIQKRGTTE